MPVLLQVSERAPLPGGYGVALLQTLLALAAVCILAWVVLRWGARRGLGLGGTGGAVRVVERVALDPRRTLYVVRVGDRVLLLGAGDGAAPTLLMELDPRALPEPPEPRGAGALFRDALGRARRPAASGAAARGPADGSTRRDGAGRDGAGRDGAGRDGAGRDGAPGDAALAETARAGRAAQSSSDERAGARRAASRTGAREVQEEAT